ncbi:MAG: family 16 glycosylhydrolase [Thermoflexales bacterium]|nr:family 16 glycosylhydrolase [Thermoflexales bacterium]
MSTHPSYFGCRPCLVGQGVIEPAGDAMRLALPSATARAYSDAQIDDYSGLARRDFPWRPPLRLSLRARFSPGPLVGTAGFGLWNNPFSPLGGVPALPRAAWFFYASPPSDMALAAGVAGRGWKAAAIDATRPAALAWAPLAPLVLLANQIPALYARLWPYVQRALCIHETLLDTSMQDWHDYQIAWQAEQVTFSVDEQIVLRSASVPQAPMGFVAWIDNQYAVATARGRLGWGLLDVPGPQWLDIAGLAVSLAQNEEMRYANNSALL